MCIHDRTGDVVRRYWMGKSAIYSSPALAGGTVFFGGRDGYLYGVDAKTFTFQWRLDAGQVIESSPAVYGGEVYFGCTDERLLPGRK
jgi:outer membrane protein assembly factor BamB